PVAWYRFEDTQNPGRDVSTLGNNGARQALAVFAVVDSQRQHVAEFRGKGQLVVPCVVRKDFCIVFWLRTGFSGGDPFGNPEELQWRIGTGLVDGDMPNIAADFGVGLYSGRLLFGVGAPNTTLSGRQVVSDGAWHHVGVGRANGGEMRIYVDGQRDATMQGPSGERTAPDRLVIGSMTTGYGALNGRLDELRFYDRLLTDAEVNEIFRVEHMGK
ncbi:MAG: LamG domain-containing protein, partial [Planctomycetes bacterium]|nr:LamG domain-containing protein [Planctomycetota bacterium]